MGKEVVKGFKDSIVGKRMEMFILENGYKIIIIKEFITVNLQMFFTKDSG